MRQNATQNEGLWLMRCALLLLSARFLFWNAGSPAPGEWMFWCGTLVKCGGRLHASASWDREGFTLILIDDGDRKYEPDVWVWRSRSTPQR